MNIFLICILVTRMLLREDDNPFGDTALPKTVNLPLFHSSYFSGVLYFNCASGFWLFGFYKPLPPALGLLKLGAVSPFGARNRSGSLLPVVVSYSHLRCQILRSSARLRLWVLWFIGLLTRKSSNALIVGSGWVTRGSLRLWGM